MDSFKKIFKVLTKNQKKKYLILSLFSLVITLLELIGLGLIFPIVSVITDPSNIKRIINELSILNFLSELENYDLLKVILLSAALFYFFKMIIIIAVSYVRSKLFYSLIASLSDTMFNGYINQPLSFSFSKNSAYTTRNIIDYPSSIVNNVLNGFYNIFFETVFILGVFAMFIAVNPKIGISILIGIILFIIIFYLLNKKNLIIYGKSLNYRFAERLKVTREAIEGIKEIRLFDKKDFFDKVFRVHNYRVAGLTALLEVKQILPKYLLEFIAILFVTISIIFLTNTGYEVKETIPIVTVIAAGLIKIAPSTSKILSSLQRLRSNKPVVDVFYDEINKFENIKKNSDELKNFLNKIDITNLSFKYPNSDYILKNINFSIKKNSIFGIKGMSGSGKTTFLNLISGFLNPSSGAVLVDGIKIQNNIYNWQNLIGYIPQEIFLIDDTIEKNICFVENEKDIDTNKLNKIIDFVRLREFIDSNDKGLKKIIGERGASISVGQMQRIALARALYKDSKLLILDEITSALDEKIELDILNDLVKLKNNLTIIIVSHSSKVMSFCDNVFDIDKIK